MCVSACVYAGVNCVTESESKILFWQTIRPSLYLALKYIFCVRQCLIIRKYRCKCDWKALRMDCDLICQTASEDGQRCLQPSPPPWQFLGHLRNRDFLPAHFKKNILMKTKKLEINKWRKGFLRKWYIGPPCTPWRVQKKLSSRKCWTSLFSVNFFNKCYMQVCWNSRIKPLNVCSH